MSKILNLQKFSARQSFAGESTSSIFCGGEGLSTCSINCGGDGGVGGGSTMSAQCMHF
ncbi:MAG: hypothetical protein AAGN66_20560 [Acidobacteriota bacterium]